MLAAINLSVRGLPCGVPNRSSAVCMCRLARMAAITPITRLRPSSIGASYTFRLVFATTKCYFPVGLVLQQHMFTERNLPKQIEIRLRDGRQTASPLNSVRFQWHNATHEIPLAEYIAAVRPLSNTRRVFTKGTIDQCCKCGVVRRFNSYPVARESV